MTSANVLAATSPVLQWDQPNQDRRLASVQTVISKRLSDHIMQRQGTIADGMIATAAAALLACLGQSCLADVFHLENGGQIAGEWLNPDEQPVTSYLVRTATGVTLRLPLAAVREAIRQSPAEGAYLRRAAEAADTAQAQWELAQWCRQAGLARERLTHLERIIALEPNHVQARQLLGYRFLNGEWIRRDDFYRQQGYEFYRGKWRTPQEIEILEARGRAEVAEKEWLVKIRRWRSDLDTERARQAYQSLAAIRDPVAVRALGQFFSEERTRRVKMLYADILAQINTPEAVLILVTRTLRDGDDEVFHYCLDRLIELKPPRVGERFVTALGDSQNATVNRAAVALARLRDTSAIAPLIDALITTHAEILPARPGTGPSSTTTVFGDGGTFAKQGEGPQVVLRHVQNQHVLDALSKLAGVSFGFDQKAWRYWHAQQRLAQEAGQPVLDARRQ